MSPRTLFLLGGTGFIGREVLREAIDSGWTVKALSRSADGVTSVEAAGATAVEGSAEDGRLWAGAAAGADALIDLVQPSFPNRLGRRQVASIAAKRRATTKGVLEAVGSLPAAERPLLISVSGTDDLAPGEDGVVSDRSPLRDSPYGLSAISVPVRGLIEESGLDATYVYFGAMVYGAGKVFADVYVDGLRRRRAPILGKGDNNLPLTHVADAARALVHVAGLPREAAAGRTYLAADGSATTQRELLQDTAELMGAPRPRSVPVAIARLVAGRAAVETMTTDAATDPSALRETGFSFRYPSHREGVPEALERLGELKS
jgi:nucleoside-diphosphate-sugar epimerase